MIGRYFMKSPITPGQNIKGANTISVVSVEVVIGQATSFAPCFAAVNKSVPSSRNLYVFSIITIALSTSIPKANINANKTTKFSVISNIERTINEINILSGIARATNVAFLNPSRINSTIRTSTNPENMLFSKFFTLLLISKD